MITIANNILKIHEEESTNDVKLLPELDYIDYIDDKYHRRRIC